MRMHELPPDERPRERCHRLGAGSLSAVELVALVLGGGSGRGSTLALARGVLQRFGTLQRLARCEPAVLESLEGIGAARSAALAAAFELGKRSVRPEAADVRTIEGPEQALALLGPLLDGLEQEAVVVLCLGARHQALQATTVALGQINAAGVHPREVFRDAIAVGAVALILAHNHPSGDPEPSEDDVRLTRRLQRCGETLGIEVLDHLVVGAGRWVSLRERRLL
jgi:DNA repair protein RadC